MKREQACPKCNGRKIWVIEAFRVPSEGAQGEVMAVVVHQEAPSAGLFALARVRPVGHFDLYVCAACGFSELWAAEIDDIKEDVAKGIRLLDASTKPAGPFR